MYWITLKVSSSLNGSMTWADGATAPTEENGLPPPPQGRGEGTGGAHSPPASAAGLRPPGGASAQAQFRPAGRGRWLRAVSSGGGGEARAALVFPPHSPDPGVPRVPSVPRVPCAPPVPGVSRIPGVSAGLFQTGAKLPPPSRCGARSPSPPGAGLCGRPCPALPLPGDPQHRVSSAPQ